MADAAGLLNLFTRKGDAGSNPALSATEELAHWQVHLSRKQET